jgi:hypothetical protein
MKIKLILLFAASFCLASCTHTPSAGERMLNHSKEAKKLGEQWTQGEQALIDAKDLEKKGVKLVHQGNKNISKGKKLISQGEKKVSLGNKMRNESKAKITEGIRLKKDSENEFSEKYPGKLE